MGVLNRYLAASSRDAAWQKRLKGESGAMEDSSASFWEGQEQDERDEKNRRALREENERSARLYEETLATHRQAIADAEEEEEQAEQEWFEEQQRVRERAETRAKAQDWAEGELESILMAMRWDPPKSQAQDHGMGLWFRARYLRDVLDGHKLVQEHTFARVPALLTELRQQLTKSLKRDPDLVFTASEQLRKSFDEISRAISLIANSGNHRLTGLTVWEVAHDYRDAVEKTAESAVSFATVRDILFGELRHFFVQDSAEGLELTSWYLERVRDTVGAAIPEEGEEPGFLGSPLLGWMITTAFSENGVTEFVTAGKARIDEMNVQLLREAREQVALIDVTATNRRLLNERLAARATVLFDLAPPEFENPSDYDPSVQRVVIWTRLAWLGFLAFALCVGLHAPKTWTGSTGAFFAVAFLLRIGMRAKVVANCRAANAAKANAKADSARDSLNKALGYLGEPTVEALNASSKTHLRQADGASLLSPLAKKLLIGMGVLIGVLIIASAVLAVADRSQKVVARTSETSGPVVLAPFSSPSAQNWPGSGVTMTSAPRAVSAPSGTSPAETDLNFATASIQALKDAAYAGSDAANTELGVRYINGKDVEKDYTAALDYFEVSANRGDPRALTNIGWMLTLGQGTPRDDARALDFFRQAAAHGYLGAEDSLGFMYEHGRGMPVDLDMAATWYRKAADQGFAKSKANLQRLSQQ